MFGSALLFMFSSHTSLSRRLRTAIEINMSVILEVKNIEDQGITSLAKAISA